MSPEFLRSLLAYSCPFPKCVRFAGAHFLQLRSLKSIPSEPVENSEPDRENAAQPELVFRRNRCLQLFGIGPSLTSCTLKSCNGSRVTEVVQPSGVTTVANSIAIGVNVS